MHTLITVFARHNVAANLLMVLMILSGLWAIQQLNRQLNPTMQTDMIKVGVVWNGASAEDVERLVTIPIEQQLRTLIGLKTLTSSTWNGRNSVRIELHDGVDISQSLDEVKQQVSLIRNLPADIEKPEVRLQQRYEMVAMLLVKGPEALDTLIPLTRSIEKELMHRGIDRISFEGLPTSEIAIEVESLKLFEMNISLDQLAQQLRNLSRDVPAGVIGEGQVSRQLRSLEQQRSSLGFAQMPIATSESGQLIRLGDIATVTRRPRQNQLELEHQGHPAIMMELERGANSDVIDLADIMHEWHKEITPTLGPGVEVQIFLQVWRFLEDNIRIIVENGLMGLILVITSLFLFLNGRVGWWVMIGIPVTFMASLALFMLLGGTLNILSLIAMVMGLGIIVDDAIVVGEDSLTHYQNGKPPEEAAVAGAKRMLPPVMASSLTTLAAFLPLVIMNDGFIKEIPIVMLCIIIASLIECFLVLPGHLRRAFEGLQKKETTPFRQALDRHFNHFRDHQFRSILRVTMNNRRSVLCGALMMFAIGITLLSTGHLKLDMDVNVDFEMIEVGVQFTNGASDEDKAAFIAHLEDTLNTTNQTLGDDNIMGYVVMRNFAFLSRERKHGPDYARLMIEYALPNERSSALNQFINTWQDNVQKTAIVEELQILAGQDYGSDISLVLRGDDLNILKAASEELSRTLAEYDGVLTVYDDLPYGREQWIINLTTEGRSVGLTTTEIGHQLRAAYDGERVQIFNEGAEELEVRVMLPYGERASLASLNQLPIRTAQGQILPLGAVADVENRRGIDVIRHHNGSLAVTVNADMDTSVNTPLAVLGHLQKNVLQDVLDKYGIEFGLGGRSAAEAKRLADLGFGALLSLALIYIVLAWIFASYIWPLAVMIAIPLGATGALIGHWAIGMNLGSLSLLGAFTLTGIVVNDSIILITTYKLLREQGMDARKAIEESACLRLRAVLLTSLTTILGLLPLIFETSPVGRMLSPLAVTICFGMMYATVLILIVVPALLSMIESTSEAAKKRFTAKPLSQTAV